MNAPAKPLCGSILPISGDPPAASRRAVYDTFISATPLAADVTLDAVNEDGVHGWWVRPQNADPAQAILYIHGGGYGLGSSKAYRGFVSQIASRTQVPALVIDYPLAPEATLPAGPNAALAAWQWLVDQGFEQIAIVGDSAGGGLSLVTLTELSKRRDGIAPVAGVVFSPWTDLSFTGASMPDQTVEDPLISYDYLHNCAQNYLGTMAAAHPLASPLFGELGACHHCSSRLEPTSACLTTSPICRASGPCRCFRQAGSLGGYASRLPARCRPHREQPDRARSRRPLPARGFRHLIALPDGLRLSQPQNACGIRPARCPPAG